jgi:F420-non-reducing hydrogenase large subunit
MNKISIDPISRLEGHGRIDLFVKDDGELANAYLVIPEIRGFEKFAEGRPVEEMPRITSRICGVCPEAHHMAAAKACDAVWGVELPKTAKMIREMQYAAFYAGDHTTHFYALGGPDFVLGPDAPAAERNLVGVIGKVGVDIGKKVIQMRKWAHEVAMMMGGKPVHPVNAIPGGVSRRVTPEMQKRLIEIGEYAVEFAQFTLKIVDDVVLANKAYVDMIVSDPYRLETYYMGLVDQNNKVNFYDGKVRVVGPDGTEHCKYEAKDYQQYVAEHVEPWSYLKFPYLKKVGWKGFVDGPESGVYQATPLSRLNASDGMATMLAQKEYERFYATLGGKPVHHTLATHWARCIELLYAGERLLELASHPDITGPDYRTIPTKTPTEGVGIVEAPRGTLTHHYKTDENGIVTKANLIVGTTNNYAPISMAIKGAARGLITKGSTIDDATLNKIEMAFRSYDPCFGCATHSLPGEMPMIVRVRSAEDGTVLDEVRRD